MSKKHRRGGGPRRPGFDPGRRRVLTGLAAATSALALGSCATSEQPPLILPTLPDPATSGVDHIVVLMMENRSFDHFLGWLPGADGQQKGLSYIDVSGGVQKTTRWRRSSRAARSRTRTTRTKAA